MDDPRHALGLAGEEHALRALRRAGLRLVARRVATPFGELDLVMREGRTVVFVEVKTQANPRFADPPVSPAQQRRLLRTASWFLHERGLENSPCRIDVVLVVLAEPRAAPSHLRHLADAIQPTRG